MTTGRINQVTIVRALGARARQAHRRVVRPAGAISSPLGRPPRVTEAARRRPPRRPPGRLLRRQASATSGSPLPPPKFPAPPSAAPLGGVASGAPVEGPGTEASTIAASASGGFPPVARKGRVPQRASNPPNPSRGARGPLGAPRRSRASSVRRAPWGAAVGRVDD